MQKQVVGQIWPVGAGLFTPALAHSTVCGA